MNLSVIQKEYIAPSRLFLLYLTHPKSTSLLLVSQEYLASQEYLVSMAGSSILVFFLQLVLYYWHIKQGIDVAIVQCGFVDLLGENCASLSVNSSSVSVSYSSNCNEQDAVRLILLFLQRSAEVDECQEKLRGNVIQASINLDETLIIYRGVTSENLNFIINISKSCSTWPLADKSQFIVCISLHGSAIPDWYHNNAVHFNNKR